MISMVDRASRSVMRSLPNAVSNETLPHGAVEVDPVCVDLGVGQN
eukprot:CAMPEP_0202696748 /NCGR_PEP_ID=MMETSP1385-20130828/10071_1 /ASSEMBLY_ACC=CAM_ASM_000861 /TAXON_ID=933848 /ORGANISM="Elphidium margaritaceum" /LENGTH=44 /DNA_ID= /DNA_START= /DNA_END= /DNA_ORIENTATION=